MATLITKNSSTASSVPTAAQLVQGELAVNVTDKRLFTENSSGTVVELGTNPSTLALPNGSANGVAYLNGSKVLTTGSALTFDGSNLTVPANVQSGGNPVFYSYNGGAAGTVRAGIQMVGTDPSVRFTVNNTEGMRLTSTGLGIGTSSPSDKLQIQKAVSTAYSGGVIAGGLQINTGYAAGDGSYGHNGITFYGDADNASFIYQIHDSSTDSQLVLGSNNAERIRINGSGNVGIGTSSPVSKLHVNGGDGNNIRYQGTTDSVALGLNGTTPFVGTVTNGSFAIQTNATTRALFDTSGNLGLGVTPSAWQSGRIALEIGSSSTGVVAFNGTGNDGLIALNAVRDATSWKYVNSNFASLAEQFNGKHIWYTAASGTAGNAITFTQAMTLSASGSLGLGITSPTNWGSYQGLEINGTSGGILSLLVNTTERGRLQTFSTEFDISAVGAIPMVFNTNGSERARIDSSGNLLVGTTSLAAGTAHTFQQTTASNYTTIFKSSRSTAAQNYGLYVYYDSAAPNGTGNEFLQCQDNAAVRATIRSNGGLANYSGNNVNLSDRREKTNFAPAGEYLSKICAIPVQTFNYIDQNAEEDPGTTLGVVAQDVQAVAPELVMESNWGTEENPKMRLSIYQTDLQYALMKALQELKAEFDAYKATHP